MTDTPTPQDNKELDHIMGWCSGVDHSPCWYDENTEGLDDYEIDQLQKTALLAWRDKAIADELLEAKTGFENAIKKAHPRARYVMEPIVNVLGKRAEELLQAQLPNSQEQENV